MSTFAIRSSETGQDVVGFYHSHPHSAAVPSETDLAEATYETTARATVPQEMQKTELDVRAAKDTFFS